MGTCMSDKALMDLVVDTDAFVLDPFVHTSDSSQRLSDKLVRRLNLCRA